MKHNTEFIQSFMARYSYPEEAVTEFTRIEKRLDSEAAFGADMDKIVEDYMFPEADGMHEALEAVKALSEKYGENEYTMDFIFILNCVPILKERYDKAGIDEKIFWDSADDLRCKLIECIDCEEVPGTFVAGWNDGFFKMTRFAYGRFQYEVCTYNWENDFTFSCGKVMHPGDTYINFHIPSSGIPLTDEVRLASYKEAYKHYKHLFPDGNVIFGCGSWLLYPRHREFLPKHLNILKFMDDFEVVGSAEKEGFPNGWRVFGKDSDLPYDQLPRDTTLRKAYADWLIAGNPGGDAFCVFLFDGEKIVR
ncbi:MAG: acyltransferase domain-containing protein [Clostridia bacterium]|nr:acyltransferase domain-containing protein [Clostridia bacterium]